MPTILTHTAVPLALGLGLGERAIPGRLLAAGVIGSMLPDLDVLAFKLGVAYSAEFGHRGFSHSLLFALAIGLIGAAFARVLRARPAHAFWFLFAAVASHPILDAFTNGGLGVALFWPFSDERLFAPVRPIEVSPLGLSRLFSNRGAAVLWSEIVWVWLPLLSSAALGALIRRRSN